MGCCDALVAMTEERDSLRQQLAECELERDELVAAARYADQQSDLGMSAPSLAEVDVYFYRVRNALRTALAKLGADKVEV